MKQEIEVKLSIAKEKVDDLLACQFIRQLGAPESVSSLRNTYFDTDSLLLNQHKIALRIRTVGDQFIQTLKTKGSSENGLSKRAEWEWQVATDNIDTSLLDPQFWPSEIDPHQLKAQFTTHFTRSLWYLRLSPLGDIDTVIEIALDQGTIAAEGKSLHHISISELELELKEGDAEQLTTVAEQLKAQCPDLQPSDVSKAVRGYQLLNH